MQVYVVVVFELAYPVRPVGQAIDTRETRVQCPVGHFEFPYYQVDDSLTPVDMVSARPASWQVSKA